MDKMDFLRIIAWGAAFFFVLYLVIRYAVAGAIRDAREPADTSNKNDNGEGSK